MGHYAFIIAAAFVVIGSILSMGLRSDTRDAEEQSAKLLIKEEAREASFTGLNLTLRKLVSHPDTNWAGTESYGIDTTDYKRSDFWTTVTPKYPGADTVDVMSRGRKYYIDPSGAYTDTTHTINVRLIYDNFTDSIPPAWKYAIMSDNDFLVGGDLTISSYDGVNPANVHSNETLRSRGNSFVVEGYGSYSDGDGVRFPDNFQPPVDENGDEPNVYQDSEIPWPQADWPDLRTKAQNGGIYSDEHLVLDVASTGYTSFNQWAVEGGYADSNPTVGLSASNPVVVFSETTIEIASDMVLDGYGVIASLNGMDSTTVGTEIHGNLQIHGGITETADGTSADMLLLSQGGVFVNGTSDITASIYSAGTVTFNGTASVTGGVVARDIAITSGTFNLTWIGLNSGYGELFGPINEVFGPRIAAWSEW
jgi:hypothetical protein